MSEDQRRRLAEMREESRQDIMEIEQSFEESRVLLAGLTDRQRVELGRILTREGILPLEPEPDLEPD